MLVEPILAPMPAIKQAAAGIPRRRPQHYELRPPVTRELTQRRPRRKTWTPRRPAAEVALWLDWQQWTGSRCSWATATLAAFELVNDHRRLPASRSN